MQTDFSSNNVMFIRFLRFSGGNFICNCLGLSKHSLLKHANHVDHLIKNPADYTYRLDAVLSTLPKYEQANTEMKKWTGLYEWNCVHLYGELDLHEWYLGQASDTNLATSACSHSGMNFFILGHAFETVTNVAKIWPNIKILHLTNSENFWRLAKGLKDPDSAQNYSTDYVSYAGNECNQKYQQLAGNDWPSWQEFEASGFNIDKFTGIPMEVVNEIRQYYPWNQITNTTYAFDIDSCIFDESKFLFAMQQLYLQLGYTDFDAAPILPYYQTYMKLHLDLQ